MSGIPITSIDCGMHMGLCYEPILDRPEVETYNLGGSQGTRETGLSYGRAAYRARQKIRDILITTGSKVCLYESPVPPARRDKFGKTLPAPPETLRVLFGLPWMIEEVCYELGVNCVEGHIQTIRRHVSGNGATKKDEMPPFVRSLLGQPDLIFPSLDSCDAAAGWLYAKAIFSHGYFPKGALLGRTSR